RLAAGVVPGRAQQRLQRGVEFAVESAEADRRQVVQIDEVLTELNPHRCFSCAWDRECARHWPCTGRSQGKPDLPVRGRELFWCGAEGHSRRSAQGKPCALALWRRQEGPQICKDMKTSRGGGAKGVVQVHSDGTVLGTEGKSAVTGSPASNAGWR